MSVHRPTLTSWPNSTTGRPRRRRSRAVAAGEPPDRTGAVGAPSVRRVPSGCPADTEETFGPVATVYEVADAEEAIAVANDTRFGLGASLWTADRERGQRLARAISAGCVNHVVASDPRVPFSGTKDSGYGTELSRHGIREFVNTKTVWVEDAPADE